MTGAIHVFMAIRKHVLVLTSILTFVFGGCMAAPPDEADGEISEALGGSCAVANAVGPCAGEPIEAAVRCATNLGARVISFYRSVAEQECVRRQNHCTNRCTGSAGCVRPTASCEGSAHSRCGSVDFASDGAPLSRAQLGACGLAKTTAPHANHYDYVGGGTTSVPGSGGTTSPSSPGGVTCSSATLGRNVSPGTCVRRSDGSWYVCDANDPTDWPEINDQSDARCTSCPQLSSGCGAGGGTGTGTGKGGAEPDDGGGKGGSGDSDPPPGDKGGGGGK